MMSKLHFQLVHVTPRMAESFHSRNSAGQWKMDTDYLMGTLVPALKEEHYPITGNINIVCDTNDDMIDGQHRMTAVKIAGVTVPMIVVTGVDPRARNKIDIGRKRTTGQVLHMLGHPDGNNLAAALGWFYAF